MQLTQKYNELIASGQISEDAEQQAMITRLQILQSELDGYKAHGDKVGWFSFGRKDNVEAPKGMYVWGGVGRGKSMMMDLFHDNVSIKKKRRLHFHAFMTEIHAKLHGWRQLNTEDTGNNDPIPPLVKSIAASSHLLCLDEFQVTDVADAVILSRLFGGLINAGVVVVATSNLPPESLYTDGLQREYFLKFVELVKSRWDIVEIEEGQDYRLQHLNAMKQVYITPLGSEAKKFMEEAYAALTCRAEKESIHLDVGGRMLTLHGHGDVCWSNFSELCEQPLGAADYLEIAREFHTVFLSGIPVMPPEMRNEAARFVKLIDALYDHRVKLICTAEAGPDALYVKGDTSFEFQRTISRLVEMQSEQYFSASHIV